MKIIYFIRKPRRGANSIEEVFNTLIAAITEEHLIKEVTLPTKTPPWSVVINWLYALRYRGDIIHITGDNHYLAIGRKTPVVITVHDIASVVRKSSHWNAIKKLIWLQLPFQHAKAIVAVSEKTKQEIALTYPDLDGKITVIPNPINPIFKPQASAIGNEHLILHVGTAPHKNLERVITALEGLDCQLLILGAPSKKQLKLLNDRKIDFEWKSDLGYPEVYELYCQAGIISFPSLYEGFGMPIIEAQAVGRPLLTSDTRHMRSIAGDAACFVSNENVNSIREGFVRLMDDRIWRASLVSQGLQNATRYRHEKIVSQYLDLYNRVYQN